MVYVADPDPAPDEDYEPGVLAHLAPGNRGRMLDDRRTPVRVLGSDAELGCFEVEVGAFEDAGARWQLSLDQVARFQFEPRQPLLGERDRDALAAAAARLRRRSLVSGGRGALERTLREIDAARTDVRKRLRDWRALADLDVPERVRLREGSAEAARALRLLLADAGLEALEDELMSTYVSNPRSGETVKAHSIAIAEAGLATHTGEMLRDPQALRGERARERRRSHVVIRLAFLRELLALQGVDSVVLHRGLARDGALPSAPRRQALVSATFSAGVAEAHYEGAATTRSAMLVRQSVSVERLFATFIETPAMCERYREAEALLIGARDAGSPF